MADLLPILIPALVFLLAMAVIPAVEALLEPDDPPAERIPFGWHLTVARRRRGMVPAPFAYTGSLPIITTPPPPADVLADLLTPTTPWERRRAA